MLGDNFEDIQLRDIARLVDIKVREGRSIEYKADHYGRRDADAKEFAADVCAFANAIGGDLLIGVEAVDGVPVAVEGVLEDNPDRLMLMIQQSIQASLEPELVGTRVKWLEVAPGRGVLVIRIPRGWNGPHRVRGNQQFYMRNENGKYPMSVTEIRDAFLTSGRIEDQIKSFRHERAEMIRRNEHPVQTPDGIPYLLFHLIPRRSLLERVDIQPTPETVTIAPLGAGGANSFYSVEGVVFYAGEWTKYSPKGASTTVFRNGVIEAVAHLGTYDKHDEKFLQINAIEQMLVRGVPEMLNVLRRAGLSFPLYACGTLLNIRGLGGRYPRNDNNGLFYPHRRNDLVLPPVEIESSLQAGAYLKPIFDMIWNAFGQAGSPNFDNDGRWALNF